MPFYWHTIPGLNLLGFIQCQDALTQRVDVSFSVCRVIAFINQELTAQHVDLNFYTSSLLLKYLLIHLHLTEKPLS